MANPSFDLVVYLWGPVWESDFRYRGKRYRNLGRDMKEAKEFLAANPGIINDADFVVEFQEHALEYLKDQWEGAVANNHPFWLFIRNYSKYQPKRRSKEQLPDVPSTLCVDCQARGKRTIHKTTDTCPVCNANTEVV